MSNSDKPKNSLLATIIVEMLAPFLRAFQTRSHPAVPVPTHHASALPPIHREPEFEREEAAATKKLGRDADRDLDLANGVDPEERARWGTLIVLVCVLTAFAAGIGFLVAYWVGANNLALGGMLALFFAALGFALVLWSHLLTVQKEAIEPREPLSDPSEEFAPALVDFREGESDIRRRGLLIWAATGSIAIMGAIFISMMRSLTLYSGTDLYSRVWKRGQRLVTADGKPVSVNSLQIGSTTIVFPEDSIGSEVSQTVLVRVHPNLLQLPQQRAKWAPNGNLAYSRVCTHAGCPVGMYEATTHLLMCPCHQSTFNVLNGACPTGGPAARPLPQLPLYADSQGFLCAAGGFTNLPGAGFWYRS